MVLQVLLNGKKSEDKKPQIFEMGTFQGGPHRRIHNYPNPSFKVRPTAKWPDTHSDGKWRGILPCVTFPGFGRSSCYTVRGLFHVWESRMRIERLRMASKTIYHTYGLESIANAWGETIEGQSERVMWEEYKNQIIVQGIISVFFFLNFLVLW